MKPSGNLAAFQIAVISPLKPLLAVEPIRLVFRVICPMDRKAEQSRAIRLSEIEAKQHDVGA
ncbi:hypothetical protein D3C87_2076330 [compost metagenome]